MVSHDYRCLKCSKTYEIRWEDFSHFRKEVACECGGVAVQVWFQAPGLCGVEEPSTRGVRRTFEPGLDIQAGRHFSSRSERERWAKSRGLVGLSPQEFHRTMKDSEPEVKYEGLHEAMEKSWQELHAGKPAPPLGHVDMSKEAVMAKEK